MATKCSKCGTAENVYFMGMCKKCYEESLGVTEESKKEISYTNASNSSNTVANKFTLVVMITKVIGYLCAIIIGIVIIANDYFLTGIVTGIVIAVAVWFSTLIFEAIAEGLNLLQDIKNRL